MMFEDGICEVIDGFYSKTIKFSDINYQIAKREDQVEIFSKYCEFLNYFDSTIPVQITIVNRAIDKADFKNQMFLKKRNDRLDVYRDEYNQMLHDKALEGQNSILREKYLTFSSFAADHETAITTLARIETDVLNNFKSLGCDTKTMSGTERLELLHNVFLQHKHPFSFKYDYLVSSDLKTKDFIAPDSFDFSDKSRFEFGDRFGQVLYLKDLPPDLSDKLLSEISDLPINMLINIHINSVEQDKALDLVKQKISFMEQQKIDEQKKALKAGYDVDMIPYELKYSLNEAEELLDDLQNKNQRMFRATIIIFTSADSLEKLDDNIYQISSVARKNNCKVGTLDYLQEEGLNSSLPLGLNHIEIQRTLTTASTAIFIPFTTVELFQSGGMYYGLNALSRNLIFFDRKSLKNANGFILGTPGCFTSDEKFNLADGTVISFKDAIEKFEDKEFKVKSFDIKNQKEVIGTARNPRKTKSVRELQEISVKDHAGKITNIKSTADHLYLMADGNYKEACNLVCGDKFLASDLEVLDSVKLSLSEAVDVYDIEVDEYENFQLECGIYVHNSGKSFAAKREMVNVLLATDDEVLIIDPEREYTPLVKGFGGEIIHISAGSKTHINPLDITMDYSDDDDPLLLKSEFILSLCELLIGGRNGLSAAEKTVIDRSVKITYAKYFSNPETNPVPTLLDFHEVLKKQPEQEAINIALALELYVTGSLGVFAQPTNIDIKNRLVVFDIKDLGKQLRTMGMLIVLDQIWNRITQNRAIGKRTWIYMDEIYLLFQNEYSANYLFELYKRARKWGGIPTGITQNVEDLLISDLARRMLSNSDYIMMLNQAPTDRQELAQLLNISSQQLGYVTNANAGQGLLFSGSSIIPFIDKFPTETNLYKMMTTKPEEVQIDV